jgi:HPt (histidine-containing phosphotransfer) domain-containing protein
MDENFAATVVRNVESSINVLEYICKEIASGLDADIDLYTITVHGMRGALANIGETDVSDTAMQLEQAGNNGDIAVISSKTPAFIDALRTLVIKYKPKGRTESAEISDDEKAFLQEKLDLIKEACEAYDISGVEASINELKLKIWPRGINGLLEEISENVLCGKLKDVVRIIDDFVNKIKEEIPGEPPVA